MNRVKIFCLLVSLGASQIVRAQQVICSAISEKGDTIEGYFIKQTKKELRLRELTTKVEQSIDLASIKMYTLLKKKDVRETFVKVTLPNEKTTFLERLVEGKLNLYVEKETEAVERSVNGKIIKTFKNVTIYYLSPGTNSLQAIREITWEAAVSVNLYDCPTVIDKLHKVNYQFKDMANIIQEYNNCKK